MDGFVSQDRADGEEYIVTYSNRYKVKLIRKNCDWLGNKCTHTHTKIYIYIYIYMCVCVCVCVFCDVMVKFQDHVLLT